MKFGIWPPTLLATVLLCSCGEDPEQSTATLVINEIVSSNDGVSIDATGQTEDWVELANASADEIALEHYSIADSADRFHPLPNVTLQPGEVIQLWADEDLHEGAEHLPFKISASNGDTLKLKDNRNGKIIDQVEVPPLLTDQAYARFPSGNGAFSTCRYTTAGNSNGNQCEPASPPSVDDVVFSSFDNADWPLNLPEQIGINELAIRPAEFVELKNFSEESINLNRYRLVLAPYPPTSGLPAVDHSNSLDLPNIDLPSGAVWSLPISTAFIETLEQQAHYEGVAVLFDVENGQLMDKVPFMHWPDGSALARDSEVPYRFRFCQNVTEGEENTCSPLVRRTLGDRARGLYTPGDFASLAAGGDSANSQSVKFLIDLHNDNAVHFAGIRRWPLHYTFVRELIDGEPELDRCDANENALFNQGWGTFSRENYSNNVTRRFHLGTLTQHPNTNLNNVEFTFGDSITPQQMRDTFFNITSLTTEPFAWTLRPQDASQVARAQQIEGTLPIVGPKAPFKDLVYQGLATGVAYGTLTYVPTDELANTALGPRTIVITNDVPNDIDFVAGLITEAFQTPLAHVNILSQSRGTPNMALPGALNDKNISDLLGKLVRLEVSEGGYDLQPADIVDAEAFWDEQQTDKTPLVPRLNGNVAQLVELPDASIDDLPVIGAKAAQLAELFNLNFALESNCQEAIEVAIPDGAFAIPMSHYLKHMVDSGAQTYLESLLDDEFFLTDLAYRKVALETLRQMIVEQPVDSSLLADVENKVSAEFGNTRVRFRSSSNTEDLEDFNGAGLYTSQGAELDDDEDTVEKAIKTVWASLWNTRAFEERHYSNVDQSSVAMAILVHAAFTNERANGVAVARNVLAPTRTDQYYINSQAGEASVTNPAPGITIEQVVYQWPPRTPTLTYHGYSSLTAANTPVITAAETRALACSMSAIQNHFKSLLDPYNENRWFTMESEFKFLGEQRTLLIKQARPYKLTGLDDIPMDCREGI